MMPEDKNWHLPLTQMNKTSDALLLQQEEYDARCIRRLKAATLYRVLKATEAK